MPDPLRIKLNGLDPAAYLESTGGVIVSAAGQSRLDGLFIVVIGGQASDPLSFDGGATLAIVTASGASWSITKLAGAVFTYNQQLYFADGSGPWLRANHCSLTQKDAPGSTALLSLFDARVSLSAAGVDPGQGSIVYPTKTGDQVETLVAPQHPEDPYSFGFFVYPYNNSGFVVRMGAVKQLIQLDHAIATDVLVDDDCDVLFAVPVAGLSATRIILDSSTAGNGTAVRTAKTSHLMMAQIPTDGQWARLRLSTSSMEVSGGKIHSVSFKGQDVWLGHVTDPATDFDTATSLFTPFTKLSYELDLAANPHVTFVYKDASVQSGIAAKGIDRFYGLRVSGLGARQGVRPALDADLLLFSLATDGTQQFHIQAGIDSFLGPKVNATDSTLGRSLEIPLSSQLGVVISGPATPRTTSLLQLDTAAGTLAMLSPSLLSAPAGITAKNPTVTTTTNYLRWGLSLPEQQPAVFSLTPNQLVPLAGIEWLKDFGTTDKSVQYGLLEHPGMQLVIDGGAVSSPRRFRGAAAPPPATNKTTITHKNPSGEEFVAYSAFFAVLTWAGYTYLVDGAEGLDEKNFIVAYPSLEDQSLKDFVKQNQLQDLQIVLYSGYAGSTGAIKDFVNKNMLAKTTTPPAKYVWSFAAGMSVLLYDDKFDRGDGTPPGPAYCDTIAVKHNAANPGGAAVKTTIAIDLSNQTKLLDTLQGVYGEVPVAWTQWAIDSPALWPKLSGRGGSRNDPSDKLWRGVFLRDLPLVIPVPKSNFPILSNLISSINNKLMLQYGWRDESGATWSAQLDQSAADGMITPTAWDSTLQISLTSLTLKGAAGSVVSSQGNCNIVLPLFKDKDTQDPLTFNAALGVNLDSSTDPITKLDVTIEKDPLTTENLPGFQSVQIKRFSTDFKTAQFDLNLLATEGLASALPFFSSTTPQKATLAFNLSGAPTPTISMILPAEAQTNLFGKWQIALEAMSIQFDAGFTETRIRGRIHLGMAEFAAVGATVVIHQQGASLQLHVELDSLSASLSFGGMTLAGGLLWQDAKGNSNPLNLTGIGNTGKDREFWATLKLSDPGVLGTNSLTVRVGNQGEISYWIAALQVGETLSVGVADVQEPALILAHNADYGGNLQKIVDDPTKSVLGAVRPGSDLITWLTAWKPSSSIGTIIAGSGFIHLASQIAEAAGKDPVADAASLSSILFSSSGLLRVDGLIMMLGAVPLRFGLAIDYNAETITAGLQGPQFSLPPGGDTYKISAGYITIRVGFKGTKFLRVGIGWPERIGNTEYERDWTKATMVYVSDFWPINTFWGGYLAELQAGPKGDHILFGLAVRAGWTWSASASIGGVVSGSAELGITLGGVFMFELEWGHATAGTPQVTRSNPVPRRPAPLVIEAGAPLVSKQDVQAAAILDSLNYIDASLTAMADWNLIMSAEIFGDVWGKASVKFLGISLCSINVSAFARFQICGSLNSGIDRAGAEVGFDVSVQILCVTFSAHASIDITLISGQCKIQEAMFRNQFAQFAPIFSAPPSAPALAN